MVAKTNSYRTEMYFVRENGEKTLLGYVDWTQDERARKEAGEVFFTMQAMDVEGILIDKFIEFNLKENETTSSPKEVTNTGGTATKT